MSILDDLEKRLSSEQRNALHRSFQLSSQATALSFGGDSHSFFKVALGEELTDPQDKEAAEAMIAFCKTLSQTQRLVLQRHANTIIKSNKKSKIGTSLAAFKEVFGPLSHHAIGSLIQERLFQWSWSPGQVSSHSEEQEQVFLTFLLKHAKDCAPCFLRHAVSRACMGRHELFLTTLLDAGATVNGYDVLASFSHTPLAIICQSQGLGQQDDEAQIRMVKRLLAAGADPNHPPEKISAGESFNGDYFWKYSLLGACTHSHRWHLIPVLLDAGADPFFRITRNHPRTIDLIFKHTEAPDDLKARVKAIDEKNSLRASISSSKAHSNPPIPKRHKSAL